MPIVVIRTLRLNIRRLRRSDLDAVAALHADPAVMGFMGRGRTLSRQESAVWLARQLPENAHLKGPHNLDWAVVEKETGRFVGRCGFMPCDVDGTTELEFGYALVRAQWGKGYATEAARALVDYARAQLGVPRLIATIHPDNHASARVAEKAGLILERQVLLPKGPRLIYGINFDAAGRVSG